MKAEIRKEILSWKGVEEKPNRYGTPSFFVNGKEFAHFHSSSQMDIRKPKGFRFGDKRAEKNPYSDEWLLFNFKGKDAEDIISLVKKVYDKLK
ncbi:MAG: DUF5519 family protein [Candidatus Aenigmarchaeota archaeon]|nr:DUF5519 family protein [Candidatus Aenigmarchaeota archaeon]